MTLSHTKSVSEIILKIGRQLVKFQTSLVSCFLTHSVDTLSRVLIDACCTQLSRINSGNKATKFMSDIDGSSPLLMCLLAFQSSNKFWNGNVSNKWVGRFSHRTGTKVHKWAT